MAKTDDNEKPIIVKKKKSGGGGGHHGGAWKVAYADFTTAMMAFFMLLWLLNVSDKKTLEGLADYFTPTAASVSGETGSGKPLSGTVAADSGSQGGSDSVMQIQGPPSQAEARENERSDSADEVGEARAGFEDQRKRREREALAALQDRLRQAIQDSPELARHRDQILVEQTPEGVRIQITDKDGRSMFREGTARFYDYAQRLVRDLGGIVAGLSNRVALIGHTDADRVTEQPNVTNWELSAERANAARRVLSETGVSADRFAEVTGKADTEPLYPTAPDRAENRRIAILVMREAPVIAPNAGSESRP